MYDTPHASYVSMLSSKLMYQKGVVWRARHSRNQRFFSKNEKALHIAGPYRSIAKGRSWRVKPFALHVSKLWTSLRSRATLKSASHRLSPQSMVVGDGTTNPCKTRTSPSYGRPISASNQLLSSDAHVLTEETDREAAEKPAHSLGL